MTARLLFGKSCFAPLRGGSRPIPRHIGTRSDGGIDHFLMIGREVDGHAAVSHLCFLSNRQGVTKR